MNILIDASCRDAKLEGASQVGRCYHTVGARLNMIRVMVKGCIEEGLSEHNILKWICFLFTLGGMFWVFAVACEFSWPAACGIFVPCWD